MGPPPNQVRDWISQKFVLGLLHLERSLVRLIKGLLYRRFLPGQPLTTILVFRTGRLGDFLNAVPALAMLRRRLPDSRITLATTVSSQPEMQSITSVYADLNALPWLEFVAPSLVDQALTFTMNGRSKGLFSMRRMIQQQRPDALFILPYMGEPLGGKLRKLLFFRLAGFRGPIFGLDGLPSRGRFQRSQYQLGLYEHEVFGPARALSECAAIGALAAHELVQQLSIPAAAMDWAGKILPPAGGADELLIAVCPGATFSHKVWPTERYIRLCRELLQRYDCRFVVVGIEADRGRGNMVSEALADRCLDMTGNTSVTQLAALLSHCRLFVGNDSGPAHMASAVGCPCVTVTSALDFPGIWEPWNSRGRVARVRIECEFCLSFTCCPRQTNACINAVDDQQVLGMCCQVLGDVLGDPPALRRNPPAAAELCPDARS